jgi:hypothetical protein
MMPVTIAGYFLLCFEQRIRDLETALEEEGELIMPSADYRSAQARAVIETTIARGSRKRLRISARP